MTKRTFSVILGVLITLTLIFVPYLAGHHFIVIERPIAMQWLAEWFMGLLITIVIGLGSTLLWILLKGAWLIIVDGLEEISDKLYPMYQKLHVLRDYIRLRSKYSRSSDDDDTIEPMYMRNEE